MHSELFRQFEGFFRQIFTSKTALSVFLSAGFPFLVALCCACIRFQALEILLDRHPDFIAEPEFIQMASHNLNFYKKILRIATQFMILDKAKLICKANSSLTFD